MLEEALAQVEQAGDPELDAGLVLSGDGWHPGVVGIVASRVVERYGRPAFLIAFDGDIGKGSGRSISRFDLHSALLACGDLLERFGGHQMAAGLTIRRDRLEEFRGRFAEIAREALGPDDLGPEQRVDLELGLHETTRELERMCRHLEPCGAGNASPVFGVRGVRFIGRSRVGNGHLKGTLDDGSTRLAAIGFQSWVGLAYSLKFLWAPLIDRLDAPGFGQLGRRRGWMIVSQLLVALGLAAIASVGLKAGLALVGVVALVVAFSSATQDIVVDAWRIEAASDADELGLLSAAYQFGYRFSVLITEAAILIAANHWGWRISYAAMAALMGVGLGATLLATEPLRAKKVFESLAETAPLWSARGFFDAVIGPFTEFFRVYGWLALMMLAMISFYQLPEYMMGPMVNPFYHDLGLSKDAVGAVRASIGLVATLLGIAAGGFCSLRFGYIRTLIAGVITVGSYLSARRDDRGAARVLPLVGCLAFLGMLGLWLMAVRPRRRISVQAPVVTGGDVANALYYVDPTIGGRDALRRARPPSCSRRRSVRPAARNSNGCRATASALRCSAKPARNSRRTRRACRKRSAACGRARKSSSSWTAR